MERVKTIGEEIIDYLEQLPTGELAHDDVWPPDATQDGIAAALSVSRAHVALELQRLMGKGLIERLQVHVRSGRQRRLVYRAVRDPPSVYDRESGKLIPITKGELRTLQVIVLRCPNCGKPAHVALAD